MKLNIKPFLKTFGKGLLKEAVSYVPVLGDNLANMVEKKIGKQITSDQTENIVEIVGKVIVAGLVLALLFGKIDRDTFSFILGEIE